MVHQHFMLADQLTVLENVILGSEPTESGGRIDYPAAKTHLSEVADAYGLAVDPDDLVESLEVGERQRVEIIKVLYRGAKILIPRRADRGARPPRGRGALPEPARAQGEQGATIIFIDHKLNEVLEISVIRSPCFVVARPSQRSTPTAVTAGDLAELMVGSELPTPDIESTVTDDSAPVALSLSSVTVLDAIGRPVVDDVSLEDPSRRDRRVSLASRATARPSWSRPSSAPATPRRGQIRMLGTEVHHGLDVRSRREMGLAYVPADRHEEGLLLDAPLWENAALGHQTEAPYAKGWLIDRPGSRAQHRRHPSRVRRAHAQRRHLGPSAVRRQPAEADHRPGDDIEPLGS